MQNENCEIVDLNSEYAKVENLKARYKRIFNEGMMARKLESGARFADLSCNLFTKLDSMIAYHEDVLDGEIEAEEVEFEDYVPRVGNNIFDDFSYRKDYICSKLRRYFDAVEKSPQIRLNEFESNHSWNKPCIKDKIRHLDDVISLYDSITNYN
tara:strand:+ start:78 stop:539 length:462 start_codon:yes stop_codon:yes gene_type:complete